MKLNWSVSPIPQDPAQNRAPDASEVFQDLDLALLANELGVVSHKLLEEPSSAERSTVAIAIQNAQIAAQKKDLEGLLEHLTEAGDQALEIAQFFEVDEAVEAIRRSGLATGLDRSRIQPWVQLPHKEFLVEEEKLADLALNRILRNVERFGICLIRLASHAASREVVESLIEMIGIPTEWQNQSEGRIKDIRPRPDVSPNTGDSRGDLGFHVDGTQTPLQPALLLFQYATGATLGAHSKFADLARILRDIPQQKRWELMTNLSAHDAAVFTKGNVQYKGPVFSYSATESLMCRIRVDEVISVKPEFREDFELLREKLDDPYYPTVFQPRDGDLVLFDNWRILHARTEVYGSRDRHHRRVWFANLKLEHQTNYLLGIRPIPIVVAAEIVKRNLAD